MLQLLAVYKIISLFLLNLNQNLSRQQNLNEIQSPFLDHATIIRLTKRASPPQPIYVSYYLFFFPNSTTKYHCPNTTYQRPNSPAIKNSSVSMLVYSILHTSIVAVFALRHNRAAITNFKI